MKLSGCVRVLERAEFGVWRVEAAASELAVLGKPRSQVSGCSIIGLTACEISGNQDFLTFQLSDASLLNLGDAGDCIAVLLERPNTHGHSQSNAVLKPDALRQAVTPLPQGYRKGDGAFIAACHTERLPETVLDLGQDFLSSIREFSDDRLQEGLHRKWVTYPKNFLAITIQNRNQQFCVHVKKTAMLRELSGTLDIRDDRPGYVRFWLQDELQLAAAVRAAKASFDL